MKNTAGPFKKKLIIAVCFISAMLAAISAALNAFAAIENDIISYQLKKNNAASVQQWIDNGLTERAGIDSEWYVLALCRSGNYDFSGYAAALSEVLAAGNPENAVERQRCALAMLSVGYTSAAVEEICAQAAQEPEKASVMKLIFGLHISNITSDTAAQRILLRELVGNRMIAGSGWAVMSNSVSPDTDVTAMALAALAPHYHSEEVKAAADKALEFLSSVQLENGGFKSYGIENCESCAQVIIALTALGIDPEADIRFKKTEGNAVTALRRFCLPSGAFCHISANKENETATVQAFCALTAVSLYRSGNGGFYKTSVGDLKEISPVVSSENTAAGTESEAASAGSISSSSETKSSEIISSGIYSEKPETPEPEADLNASGNTASEENIKTDNNIVNRSDTGRAPPLLSCIISAAIFAAGIVVILFLRLKKCGTIKDYALIATLSIIFCIASLFLRIETPDQYYSVSESSASVTLTVSCKQLEGKTTDAVPENGFIIENKEIVIAAGDTVLDVLNRAAHDYSLEISQSGSGSGAYIRAINGIYELQFGELSGWIYTVNGDSPNIGCGAYRLNGGEKIVWAYTVDGEKITAED